MWSERDHCRVETARSTFASTFLTAMPAGLDARAITALDAPAYAVLLPAVR